MASLGPVTPVCRAGAVCDRPYGADLRIVYAGSGALAAVVHSDSRTGRFKVALFPGDYRLEGADAAGPPTAKPVGFTVRAHAFTTVSIAFDSGIR